MFSENSDLRDGTVGIRWKSHLLKNGDLTSKHRNSTIKHGDLSMKGLASSTNGQSEDMRSAEMPGLAAGWILHS